MQDKLLQGCSDVQVLLLCRLHYVAPCQISTLVATEARHGEFERALAARLAERSLSEVNAGLEQLQATGLVSLTSERWEMTEKGRSFAYNLCELEIQRLSGFWEEIAADSAIRGGFDLVLDIGCSGGLSAISACESGLLAEGGRYFGLDVDRGGLRAGRDLLARFSETRASVILVEGDANRLPFTDGAVECIISRATLYYLQKRKVLLEIARVLAPGGCLIVTVPTLDYMAKKAVEGMLALRFRQALRYSAAVLLGGFAWLGFDVRPPCGTFIGETRRGMASRLKNIPELEVIRLERVSLPFLGTPLLLAARKMKR